VREAISREQLFAEVAALRLRVSELQRANPEPPAVPERVGAALTLRIGVGADGRVLSCDEAAAAPCGVSPDDAPGLPLARLLAGMDLSGTLETEVGRALSDALDGGFSAHVQRTRVRWADGRPTPASLRVRPETQDGTVTGALLTFTSLLQMAAAPGTGAALEGLLGTLESLTGAGTLAERLVEAAGALLAAVDAARVVLTLPGLLDGPQGHLRAGDVPLSANGMPMPIGSVAAVPVPVNGQPAGLLSIAALERGHFTPERVRVLRVVAGLVGAMCERDGAKRTGAEAQASAQVLRAASAALAGEGNFPFRAQRVLRTVSRPGRSEAAAVGVLEADGESVRWIMRTGKGPVPNRNATTPVRESLSGRALLQGRASVIDDVRESFSPGQDVEGAGSACAVPLLAGGALLGVALITAPEPGAFTPARAGLLETVGGMLGAALHAEVLTQESATWSERAGERLAAFRSVAADLAVERDPEEVLTHLVDTARALTGGEVGALAEWDRAGRLMGLVYASAKGGRTPTGQRKRALGDVLALLHSELTPAPERSVSATWPVAGGPKGAIAPVAVAAAPMPAADGGRAALLVLHKRGAPRFDEEDVRVLELLATGAGVARSNARTVGVLARAHGELAGAIATVPQGMVLLEAGGQVRLANATAERLLGLRAGRLSQASLPTLLRRASRRFANPTQVERLARALERRSHRGSLRLELELTSPARRTLALTLFPLAGAGRAGLLLRDVSTEREAAARRDAFLFMAAHELRTPVTAVAGFADLLMSMDPDEAERTDWLGRIHRDSQRLVETVGELLDVSRLDAGRLHAERASIDAQGMLERVRSVVSVAAPAHPIHVDVPAGIPPVRADEVKLEQVLVNLATNAAKYSPPGGPVRLSARHEPERRRIVLSVSDDGIGIAPEDQKRIFEVFHRVQRPETREVTGTGLGLYIVKGLVRLMRGRIRLESAEGEGSTFSVALPAAAQRRRAQGATPTPEVTG
jgi:signal transduction histidine kinase/putative methionine-R-sulfoxide reductase with GAF domain